MEGDGNCQFRSISFGLYGGWVGGCRLVPVGGGSCPGWRRAVTSSVSRRPGSCLVGRPQLWMPAVSTHQLTPSTHPALAADPHTHFAQPDTHTLAQPAHSADATCTDVPAGTPRHHAYVRRKAVEYMRLQRHDFEAFLGEEFSSYAK